MQWMGEKGTSRVIRGRKENGEKIVSMPSYTHFDI